MKKFYFLLSAFFISFDSQASIVMCPGKNGESEFKYAQLAIHQNGTKKWFVAVCHYDNGVKHLFPPDHPLMNSRSLRFSPDIPGSKWRPNEFGSPWYCKPEMYGISECKIQLKRF